MYRFNESLYLGISFNDIELPLNNNTLVVETMLITTNVKMSLPSCSLIIRDKEGFFESKCSLAAELPFIIKFGTSPDNVETFKFRIFTPSESKSLEETVYSIIGVYQSPRYILESRNTPLRGTSSAVLKTITEECGLKYSGVDTADAQVWNPGNNKNHVFVRQIVSHSYIGKSSCLRHGVTGSGDFRLRNLATIDTGKNPVFWRGIQPESAGDSYQLYDLNSSTNSGFSNSVSGYAQSMIQQSGLTDITVAFKHVELAAQNPILPLNATIKNGIKSTRILFAPIDCGNNHSNYEEASYQNTRIAHLYSSSVVFMHGSKTSYDVLDVVTILQQSSRDFPPDSMSGNYIITGKAIFLQGTNFYEKFEGVRLGNTVDTTNTQAKR